MVAPAAAAAKEVPEGARQIPGSEAQLRLDLLLVGAAEGQAQSVYPGGAVHRVRVAME
jgi:hypothetical protein